MVEKTSLGTVVSNRFGVILELSILLFGLQRLLELQDSVGVAAVDFVAAAVDLSMIDFSKYQSPLVTYDFLSFDCSLYCHESAECSWWQMGVDYN